MSTFALAGLIKVTFPGAASAGDITVTGVKAGDIIVSGCRSDHVPPLDLQPNDFVPIIATDDTIHQSTSGLDGEMILMVLARFG